MHTILMQAIRRAKFFFVQIPILEQKQWHTKTKFDKKNCGFQQKAKENRK